MRVEFNTVYTDFENEKFAELYVKHCDDATVKKLKSFLILVTVAACFALVPALSISEFSMLVAIALWYAFCLFYYFYTVKKLLPKNLAKLNKIICPSKITMGFYDEYFYEKTENNMRISESSIRYEFLKKVVETDEFFIVISKNHRGMLLPKRDIHPDDVMMLSNFFRSRVPHIFKCTIK